MSARTRASDASAGDPASSTSATLGRRRRCCARIDPTPSAARRRAGSASTLSLSSASVDRSGAQKPVGSTGAFGHGPPSARAGHRSVAVAARGRPGRRWWSCRSLAAIGAPSSGSAPRRASSTGTAVSAVTTTDQVDRCRCPACGLRRRRDSPDGSRGWCRARRSPPRRTPACSRDHAVAASQPWSPHATPRRTNRCAAAPQPASPQRRRARLPPPTRPPSRRRRVASDAVGDRGRMADARLRRIDRGRRPYAFAGLRT